MDEKVMLGVGALVVVVLFVAMRSGGGRTITNANGAGDAGVTASEKVGLISALAGTAASLDQTKIEADAQSAHDQSALNLASLSAQFGKYKIDADARTAASAAAAAQAINDRNAAAQEHASNNGVWSGIITAATTLASIFL